MSDYTDPEKAVVRAEMIATRKFKPRKVAAFLPASECLCIKEALRQGHIDTNTTLIVIEGNKDKDIRWRTIRAIKIQLVKLGFAPENVHLVPYHLKNPKAIRLLKKYGGGEIGYAFLDCCGEPTQTLLELITKYRLFSQGAYVAFTFTADARCKVTLKYCGDHFVGFEKKY